MEWTEFRTSAGEIIYINLAKMLLKKNDEEYRISMITLLGPKQKIKVWLSKKGVQNNCFEFVSTGTVVEIE